MVYRFECKKRGCKFVLEDTSKGRFDYNKKQHKEKHKREDERKRKTRTNK